MQSNYSGSSSRSSVTACDNLVRLEGVHARCVRAESNQGKDQVVNDLRTLPASHTGTWARRRVSV